MRGLSLDQLRALVEVADLGSFSAAARRLNLSQPAVSLQLRELEQRLGITLIERIGKKAFPTEAGREVIAHARRLQAEEASLLETVARRRTGWLGRVRLGAGPNLVACLLPPVLSGLRKTHPAIELAVRTGATPDLCNLVAANELDIAIVTLPVDSRRLVAIPYRADRFLAVMPEGQAGIPDRVTPKFYENRPLILDGRSQMDRLFREWLRAGGVEPRPSIEIGNAEALRRLIAAGLGVSLIAPEWVETDGVPFPGIAVRPLDPPLWRRSVLVLRADKKQVPALKIVQEALMVLANNDAPAGEAAAAPAP